MEIIPAIDIIGGKCVRLEQGDFSRQKIYNENPLEVARQFEDAGIRRLHLVDLDGAKAGSVKNWKVLESISSKTKLLIDFGGGIKTEHDLDIIFNSGPAFATVGSLAVTDQPLFINWLRTYGAHRFILGADVWNEKIAIHGWTETTETGLYDFIKKFTGNGIRQVFCTDISRDGKLEGPAVDLYKEVVEKFPDLYLIASGGISSMADLENLRSAGCRAAIIGKAIYEGRILLKELVKF